MMNLAYTVFHEQIGRLVTAFGKRLFLKERVDMIWEICKVLTDEEMTQVTDQILKNARQAPLPRDFETHVKKIMDRKYQMRRSSEDVVTRSTHESKPKCPYCCDTGVLEAKINGEDLAVHFICDCTAGDPQSWRLPTWGEHFGMEYTRLVMWPDRAKKWIPRKPGEFENLQNLWAERLKISEQYWRANAKS